MRHVKPIHATKSSASARRLNSY